MDNILNKTIVIVGPTASGKSDLAIALAHTYNGEIISADSRQVYRDMNIGTGKVKKDFPKNTKTKTQRPNKGNKDYYSEGIRHHLIDVASPKRTYNVTHFIRDTKKSIADIRKREKTPIICGGTGFWVQSFIEGNNFPLVKPDVKLRKRLKKLSAEKLFSMLKKKDPRRAETIDAKNKVRLIRALEICASLGSVPQTDNNQQLTINDKEYIILSLNPSKEILNKNIEVRLEKRLKQGMVAEMERLREGGLSWKRLENFGLEYKY
ncbi:MAG: tRNA (adenosine(37)-N6)-dimethylallyltransferase MiaA, partial [Candidatus Moraniibacteriota bacterium]